MTTQLSIPQNALTEKNVQPFTALCFTTRATLQTLSQHASSVTKKLYEKAQRLNLIVAGPIHWIYTGVNGDETNEFQLEIALPIQNVGSSTIAFTYKEFPAFWCTTYTHIGPWSDFGELYDALFGQLHRDGHQNDGIVREVYEIIDMTNPSNCVTEIQIGLV